MSQFLFVVLFFLIAFAGLAAGLLLKRKGIKGGACHTAGTHTRCQCKEESK